MSQNRHIRTRKWPKQVFLHCLAVAVDNCYIIARDHAVLKLRKRKPIKRIFLENLCRSILKECGPKRSGVRDAVVESGMLPEDRKLVHALFPHESKKRNYCWFSERAEMTNLVCRLCSASEGRDVHLCYDHMDKFHLMNHLSYRKLAKPMKRSAY